MKPSNYIELAIMLVLIIVSICLIICVVNKVAAIECDCKIYKGSQIKGKRINKIDESDCGENEHKQR